MIFRTSQSLLGAGRSARRSSLLRLLWPCVFCSSASNLSSIDLQHIETSRSVLRLCSLLILYCKPFDILLLLLALWISITTRHNILLRRGLEILRRLARTMRGPEARVLDAGRQGIEGVVDTTLHSLSQRVCEDYSRRVWVIRTILSFEQVNNYRG